MKTLNYDQIVKRLPKRSPPRNPLEDVVIHKSPLPSAPTPDLSIVLLDWSCRESYHTLRWLNAQNLERSRYEIIWIDLYDRVPEEAMEHADVVVTCSQRGMYHKHKGYNIGALLMRGKILTVCDSDAVYPRQFLNSILDSFVFKGDTESLSPLVLFHHQFRTSFPYPEGMTDAQTCTDSSWEWWPLTPNAGACVSFRRSDVVRFGGFDEDDSLRGYLCGPYELAWRLANAGLENRWHATDVTSWHFAHPDPVGTNGLRQQVSLMWENRYPHVDLHALTAVEAFSTGRFLPLQENPRIFEMRMSDRKIASAFEKKFSILNIGQNGFSYSHILRMRIALYVDIVSTIVATGAKVGIRNLLRLLLPEKQYARLRQALTRQSPLDDSTPVQIGNIGNHQIWCYRKRFFAIPEHLAPIDLTNPIDAAGEGIIIGNSEEQLRQHISAHILSGHVKRPDTEGS